MPKIKTKFFLLFAGLLIITSCSDDDVTAVEPEATCFDGIRNGDELGVDCGGICFNTCFDELVLEGELVTRRILSSEIEYTLNGPYIIRDGAILEIEAGTIIKATPNNDSYLIVAQGGQIYIYGESDNPVIITSASENPEPGDWGGLVICGQATTNNGINARSDLGDIFYGGNNNIQGSGTIRYLRLEYTGALFRNEKRFNALTLYGIGSSTNFSNIQAYESMGNAFEIFGGTLNISNLVALNTGLAGIKVSGGWTGAGDSWYLTNQNNSGIELGNNPINFDALPITDAFIENITINGPLTNGALAYNNGGGFFNLFNIYTSSISLGININSDIESLMVDVGNLEIENIEFENPSSNFIPTNYSGATNFYSEGIAIGAGNRNELPDWAQNWTIGF
ncbi:hypothetical protein [Winogradskyella sp. A2]|uniref:hypothetical protein n=1 Tax=Winogradskyella sp. A2 TaxID=3366944 RepID=UPI00398C3820